MFYKITLSYDGSHYFGWQKTSFGPSIEGQIEAVLSLIVKSPWQIHASSRTDRGVHALEQVLSLETKDPIDANNIQYRMNRMLPDDIRVISIKELSCGFHPSLDALQKTYRYQIINEAFPSPFMKHYHWHVAKPLDLKRMKEAAKIIEGKKDFSCFCNMSESYPEDTYRTIFEIDIKQIEKEYVIEITGDRFMYKMVRNIVGSLIEIGKKELDIDLMKQAIHNKDRKLAGVTAPAHALFLKKIHYSIK